MRVLWSVVVLVMFAAVLWVAQAQEQQGPPPGQQPREGKAGGPGQGGPPPEVREKIEQLRSLDQRLMEAERAAYETNPEAQALRQEILDTLDQVAEKVRALEQKVDDTVVKNSPESAQLIKEKQELIAALEGMAGPRKTGLWLQRMMRLAGPGRGGRPEGGPPREGRGEGGPAQPGPATNAPPENK
jgi:hypothetical protein